MYLFCLKCHIVLFTTIYTNVVLQPKSSIINYKLRRTVIATLKAARAIFRRENVYLRKENTQKANNNITCSSKCSFI